MLVEAVEYFLLVTANDMDAEIAANGREYLGEIPLDGGKFLVQTIFGIFHDDGCPVASYFRELNLLLRQRFKLPILIDMPRQDESRNVITRACLNQDTRRN